MSVPEYTVITAVSIVLVVALERWWLRTGIFRTAQYWWTIAIVFAFQIPVDGYLTKLSNPVVVYNEREMLGIRFPWDIPIEDFGFGFSMVTLVLILWRHRATRTGPDQAGRQEIGSRAPVSSTGSSHAGSNPARSVDESKPAP